ncbi:MAG: hypothetical protein QM800_02005 [Paludibacter sp.]
MVIKGFFVVNLCAQSISNYTFNAFAPVALEDMNSGTTQLIGGSANDVASGITDIGFTHYFMSVPYTQFSVNSNGQLKLGTSLIPASAISNSIPNTPLLVPMSGDNNLLSTGKVHYKLKGSAPNRILIVEWKDLIIPYPINDNNPPVIEYTPCQIQVHIYESTGLIEFKYGTVGNNSLPGITRSTFISSDNSPNTVKYIGSDMVSAINGSPAGTYVLSTNNIDLLLDRLYSFTPPVAPVAPGWKPEPITSITGNSLTLNWNDLSANETGFLIYCSTNGGASFSYVATTAANATSYVVNGSLATLNNWWKIAAVNEGAVSAFTIAIKPDILRYPQITSQPQPVVGCVGNSETFTVLATSNSAIAYQWQKSTDGGSTWTNLTNGAPYSGVLTNTLQINPTTLSLSGNKYRAVLTNIVGVTISNGALLTIQAPVSNAGIISGSTVLVQNAIGVPYSVSAIPNATSYSWSYTGSGVSINGTGNSVTLDFAANATAGQLSVRGINSCGAGVASVLDIAANKVLTITMALLEGLYNGNGAMRQARDASGPHWPVNVADHITVELHDATIYSTVVYSAHNISLSTAGTATISVPAQYNASYYITIKHRNSIQTTTSSPVSFAGSSINKSFGTPAGVYGGNLGLSADNHYLIYTGDVTQDGIVDTGDMNQVDNGSKAILMGYNASDINGDGIVDTSDMNFIDTNSMFIVHTKLP